MERAKTHDLHTIPYEISSTVSHTKSSRSYNGRTKYRYLGSQRCGLLYMLLAQTFNWNKKTQNITETAVFYDVMPPKRRYLSTKVHDFI